MKRKKLLLLYTFSAMSLGLMGCGGDGAESLVSEDTAKETSEVSEEPDTTENVEVLPDENYAASPGDNVIVLSGQTATINGEAVSGYEYVWHTDPSSDKEWCEGTEPKESDDVYIAHDIWYYPELNEDGFTKENYDGESEWVYRYTAEGLTDYVYSTLPDRGDELPTYMMHSASDAYDDPVLHITKPGTYILQGTWDGQIFVDLGEEAFDDEDKKIKLVLNGVEVSCDTAPAFIAYNAYECDNTWEEKESWSDEVDTTNAGVQIVVADGTLNSFTGANVYRLLKPEYKKDSTQVQKKQHKIDGAFYSFVSMNIDGQEKNSGILNIRSTTFEGLDDELHLTIDGGNINIYSQDDGINVNEDKVSVFTMNGGTLHIFAGLGSEGDVIDSNGYIVVNGGIIAGGTPSMADEILDSDCGNKINGGEVINIGSSRDGMNRGGKMPGEIPDGMPEGQDGMPQRPENMPEGQDGMPQRPENMPEADKEGRADDSST